jgi:TRAP-type C4-dicarboxylate transport system substrate-binding protein
MSFVATKWQSLSEEERKIWQDKAKTVEEYNPEMLTASERRRLISKGKKNLIKEVC